MPIIYFQKKFEGSGHRRLAAAFVYFSASGHSDPFQVILEGQMRSKKVRQLLNLIKNQISVGDGQINKI